MQCWLIQCEPLQALPLRHVKVASRRDKKDGSNRLVHEYHVSSCQQVQLGFVLIEAIRQAWNDQSQHMYHGIELTYL